MKLHVQRLQDAFRRMVVDAGECWAPGLPGDHLAAQVRAVADAPDAAARRDPLTEIVVVALCLANQYGCVLQHPLTSTSGSADLADLIARASTADPPADPPDRIRQPAQTVVQTLAYYRSDVPPGTRPDVVGLHAVLPELIRLACAGFDSADDLADRLTTRLRAARRPSGDVTVEFDPSCAESVRLIRPVQDQTYCPFAQKSFLWGPPPYDRTLSFAENMTAALPWVHRFVRVLDGDVLDGFVFAFPTDVFGESIDDLGRLFRAFVDHLVRTMTSAAPGGLEVADVTDPQWYLVLAGEECFVSVFAPCYPHDHSRYLHGVQGWMLFMLQPEKAILRQLTVADYGSRSAAIRERFRDGFQPYALADREADRFLLPLRAGDPPVRWYETPTDIP
ncbi:YqcI/YcgG family protein [Micromonospora sp. WMMD714]|uniref:YqcI/YcgG family protein n=1 Tax=Micromonospora sp. WMMD714 TaxID=3016097 RepID=UPI00249A0333|nr:YqcI/YcgG family protein [Micromonospora sp. WMMD714]WFE63021.1 YqcI/YcgG family protein [Micromonospora sp. WMMD714]